MGRCAGIVNLNVPKRMCFCESNVATFLSHHYSPIPLHCVDNLIKREALYLGYTASSTISEP